MRHKLIYFPVIQKSGKSHRPFPFKGKARMGMGSFATFNPIPTPTLPLKGREFATIGLKLVPLHTVGLIDL
jgi:hypothetical protein